MTSSTLLGDGWNSVESAPAAGNPDTAVTESGAEVNRESSSSAADTTVISENNGLLSVSAGLVAVLSYACTLLMVNSLESAEYSAYAAAQMLLGIAGTIAGALVPLPLSHAVATNPIGSDARREGLAFALLVSLIVGTGAALLTASVTAAFATTSMALAVGLSTLLFFVVSACRGWLQGELRFKRYAVVGVAEVAIRLGFSLLVVIFAWGATGGVLGFAIGALVVMIVPLSFYKDLRFLPTISRQWWRWLETGDIALVLCVVSALIGLDVVVVPFLDDGTDAAAGFQALSTIAKGPVYIAAGTALVAFPLLRSANANPDNIIAHALRAFGGLALPAAVVIATVPQELMMLVLPARYHSALELLPWLAAAGLGYATLSVLATILLALRLYRRCQLGLFIATLAISAGIFAGWNLDGVRGLAIGSSVSALLAAAIFAAIAAPKLPSGTTKFALRAVIAAAVLTGIFKTFAVAPVLWFLFAMTTGVLALVLQRRGSPDIWQGIVTWINRWRASRVAGPRIDLASPMSGFVVVVTAALGVRAVGLHRAFELWVDEMVYAELGRSVSRGQLPNLADGPFFLHPPGFFVVEGLVINAFGFSGSSFQLAYDLRWLSACVGALSVGLAFLLVRKLTNSAIAASTAIVMTFEPFVLRNNSRVFIETFGMAVVLGGLLVIITFMGRKPGRLHLIPMGLGGLMLGYGILTKDVFLLATVAPVFLAMLWKRTLSFRHGVSILIGSIMPYAIYVVILNAQGMLPLWLWSKTNGVRRFLGYEQITGFNAEGSPSLLSRMIDQVSVFGTSYFLLGFGPVAALLVCLSSRPERRLVGLAGSVMGLFGVYSAAFGTFEENYGYPVIITGILSISVLSAEICERRRSLLRPVAGIGLLFVLLTVSLGMRAATTTDNGYARLKEWTELHLPADALVSVTNDTGEWAFSDDSRFGIWPSPELMEQNGVDYIVTQSTPTKLGYGYANPELLEWLETTATEVVSFGGPSNGATTLWRVDKTDLEEAADAGIGLPSGNFEPST